MKYEQPWGISDPNGSYLNGNPSTGTMGSIPPAASIENPQREIINLITDAGGTPTDADLHQLAKAIQGGGLTYAVDTGSTNNYSISVHPPLLAYAAGQRWGVKVANTNTGAATLNINGLGARPIIYPSGGALTGNEMLGGAIVTLIDDGVHLQLQNVQMNLLSAPLTYYVNVTTGSDTLYDGTAAAISGAHGPFATVQRAITAALKWNQNGFNVTVNVADGIYAPFWCPPPNGSGSILIVGNNANPIAVLIHATAGEAIEVEGNGYQISGMSVQSDSNGSPPHIGAGLRVIGSMVGLYNLNFAACYYAHMLVHSSAGAVWNGADAGLPNNFYSVSGNSPVHMQCSQNSLIQLNHIKLTTSGPLSIPTAWAYVDSNGVISSSYSSQALGGAVTGQKYNANFNGVINTGGAGVNYFPGSVAGAVSTGGQYG